MAKKRTTKSAKTGKPAQRRVGKTRATAKKRSAPKKRRAASARARAPKAAKNKATPKTNTRTARKKNAARSAASRSVRQEPKPKEPSKLASAATAVKGAMANAVAAVAKRMPGAKPDMDAITLLETDHRRLEDLLKQGEQTTERAVKGRTELLGTLTAELAVHELIEEKILYPALKEHPEAREIVLEGFQEHHVADVILKELHQVARDDEQWGAKFKVLKENIEHHIKEEEGPMFRTARGVMSREGLQALGARMAKMKSDAEQGKLPR